MIQLTTLSVPGLFEMARPEGAPPMMTSDFALALAGLSAIATEGPVPPGEQASPDVIRQAPAAAGKPLPGEVDATPTVLAPITVARPRFLPPAMPVAAASICVFVQEEFATLPRPEGSDAPVGPAAHREGPVIATPPAAPAAIPAETAPPAATPDRAPPVAAVSTTAVPTSDALTPKPRTRARRSRAVLVETAPSTRPAIPDLVAAAKPRAKAARSLDATTPIAAPAVRETVPLPVIAAHDTASSRPVPLPGSANALPVVATDDRSIAPTAPAAATMLPAAVAAQFRPDAPASTSSMPVPDRGATAVPTMTSKSRPAAPAAAASVEMASDAGLARPGLAAPPAVQPRPAPDVTPAPSPVVGVPRALRAAAASATVRAPVGAAIAAGQAKPSKIVAAPPPTDGSAIGSSASIPAVSPVAGPAETTPEAVAVVVPDATSSGDGAARPRQTARIETRPTPMVDPIGVRSAREPAAITPAVRATSGIAPAALIPTVVAASRVAHVEAAPTVAPALTRGPVPVPHKSPRVAVPALDPIQTAEPIAQPVAADGGTASPVARAEPLPAPTPGTVRTADRAPVTMATPVVSVAPAASAPVAGASVSTASLAISPEVPSPSAAVAAPARAIATGMPVAARPAPAPITPQIQPAVQAFAAAMFAVVDTPATQPGGDPEAELAAAFPLAGLGGTTTAGPLAVHVPLDARAPALDLARDDWMGSMIERIETMRDSVDSTIRDTRIRLTPDAMGNVDVSIRHDAEGVTVRIAADTNAARAILAEAAPKLNELAEARGLKLAGASVESGTGGSAGFAERQPRQPDAPQPIRPRSAAANDDTDTETDLRIA